MQFLMYKIKINFTIYEIQLVEKCKYLKLSVL